MQLMPRTPLQQKMITVSNYLSIAIGKSFPNAVPMIFCCGFPKSGTTWGTHLIADYMQWPFPRLSLLPIGCQSVLHCHIRPTAKSPRLVYMVRDGRDAYVSLYFHLARGIPAGDHPAMPPRFRKMFSGLVNKDQVRQNMPAFLTHQMRHPYGVRLNWSEHYRAYQQLAAERSVPLLRYERLLEEPETELAQAMTVLTGEEANMTRVHATVEKFRFKSQTGRESGREDRKAFLRKGVAGDWANHFTREAAEIFDRHCGQALIDAGYEKDRSWIDRCNKS